MKKIIISLSACIFAVLGVNSCQKSEIDGGSTTDKHTVTFNATLEDNTKTALLIKVVPSWKNTSDDDVYLYENGVKGTNCKIETPIGDSYEKARFSADFAATTASSFVYTGVVANYSGGYFTVPATQSPDNESLLDPKADFLVGKSEEFSSAKTTAIDMKFGRPVALSRLAITNLDGKSGEVIKSVKIVSADYLTGKAAYSDIDFENKTANFTGESKELTMDYGTGVSFGGTFYAYFVSLTGTKSITSVVVVTNKCTYTKTIGKSSTFNTSDFKNIALDMTDAEREYVKTYYVKVTSGTVAEGTYLIVYDSGTTKYAFDAGTSSSYRKSVTISDSKIEATEALATSAIEITKSGTNYNLKTSEGYVYYSSGIAFSSSAKAHTISLSNSGTATITYSSNRKFYYGSSKFSYSTSSANVALYLLEGSALQDRNLQFAESSVSKKPGDSDFTNTLNGVTTGVTYTSSVPSVATVNATTGLVHIVGEGTTTITASAPETDTYKAGEASYTLTVTDPTKVATYKPVTSVTIGKTYLIVNVADEKALQVGTTSAGNERAVTLTSGNIVSNDFADCEFVLSKSGDNYEFKAVCDNSYLSYVSGNTALYGFTSSSSDNTKFTLTTSSYVFYFKNVGATASRSSSGEYLYFKTVSGSGTNHFRIGNSGSSVGIHLFEKQ